MRFIWQLLYPIAVYDLATACLFLAFPGGEALLLQGVSAAAAILLLTPVYRRRGVPGIPGAPGRDSSPADIGAALRAVSRTMLLPIITGAAAAVCFNCLLKISGLMGLFPGYESSNALIYGPPLWQQLLLAGILIPAAEEVVFRGLVFRTLRQRLRFFPAAMICAALFGLYHGSVIQGLYAFLVGLVLAWGAESGGLFRAVLIHISANLAAILLEAAGAGRIFEEPQGFLAAAAACICLRQSMRLSSARGLTAQQNKQEEKHS